MAQPWDFYREKKKKKWAFLCNIVECQGNASKQMAFKCEYLRQHFSVAWEEKVIFLLVLLQLSVKNKEKSLCQTARSFTTHCRHLCSSASLQFDAIMCQTAVSSEDTSKGPHSPLCLRPVIFPQKEPLAAEKSIRYLFNKWRNVLRKTVESVEKVAFGHRDVAPKNKMEVVIWHSFANMTAMQHNIKKIKIKHRTPLNGLDIYMWQICWLARGSSMSPSDICARNAVVMILSLTHLDAIVRTASCLSREETNSLLPFVRGEN